MCYRIMAQYGRPAPEAVLFTYTFKFFPEKFHLLLLLLSFYFILKKGSGIIIFLLSWVVK